MNIDSTSPNYLEELGRQVQGAMGSICSELMRGEAVELYFSIYLADVASRPPRIPKYEFALTIDWRWKTEASYGGEESEILLDFAVCRQSEMALLGANRGEVFGEIPFAAWVREQEGGFSRSPASQKGPGGGWKAARIPTDGARRPRCPLRLLLLPLPEVD